MNYVISDIHNDKKRLDRMLEKISFSADDHLYVLGDLFDRSEQLPDPVGVYYRLLGLGEQCSILLGNHDLWLARYITDYFRTPKRKRAAFRPYPYNTFSIMSIQLTPSDMLKIADDVMRFPVQLSITVEGEKYLLAHSMTSPEDVQMDKNYYLMGPRLDFKFLRNGIEGYTSVCGHHPTSTIREWYGDDYRPEQNEIWHNSTGNVYMIDCGCGFSKGRLACLRLEDKAEYYV